MKKYISISILAVLLSSCATLFNKKKTKTFVLADTPVKVIYHKDTIQSIKNTALIYCSRQKEPDTLTVFNDSVTRKIILHSGNSFSYWLNTYATLGVGTLIDKNRDKRYTYPRKVKLEMKKPSADTAVYLPISHNSTKYKNNIKITPVRLLLSHPGIELSYERYIGNKFSVQVSAAKLYNISFEQPSGSGYQFSVEGKYFDRPRGKNLLPYTSVEVGYFDIGIEDIWTDYRYNSIKDSSYIKATYDGHKTLFYVVPKLGAQTTKGRFICDFYIGLGIKYEEGTYVNKMAPYNEIRESFWTAKPALNAKIGWRF